MTIKTMKGGHIIMFKYLVIGAIAWFIITSLSDEYVVMTRREYNELKNGD